ncbi:hypothetical protein ACET3Z_006488 [Daucus carota]
MGKSEKTGLGRSLVKHHNNMIQQSKDKGKVYKSLQKKVLESVTEVTDIEAVIEQADEAELLYSNDKASLNPKIDMDSTSSTIEMTPEQKREQQEREQELHASSLRVPRRPPWTLETTIEELDTNERQAFLIWRRDLARLEENENLVLTPFEKNLDIWRQLWRVLERSDLMVMVVDARDPLFYRCPDLEAYAKEIDEDKKTLLLINKADLLPFSIRDKWAKYFRLHGILFVFWSAKVAAAAVDGKEASFSSELQNGQDESVDDDTRVYGREELLARLQSEAEEIAAMKKLRPKAPVGRGFPRKDDGVTVGFVGYPNVGKSSTINALVGEKKTGVTHTPGKTKHFQTINISDKLTLCDCPGLVFPSFTSSRYEMIASGVLPIDRMTEHREAIQVAANRVPRHVIESVYKISLPRPKTYEPQNRPPLASEFLRAYCTSRGWVASSGLPDETRAARIILKDYIDGKLPHYELPPDMSAEEAEDVLYDPTYLTSLPEESEEESSGDENNQSLTGEDGKGPSLEHVLDDLSTFDIDNGLASTKVLTKKKPSGPSHKQHKKPQRNKNRSWRVKDNGEDGMAIVRAYQKPLNSRQPVEAG